MGDIDVNLNDRINELFRKLEHYDVSSEEYKRLSDELQKLLEIKNSSIKVETERDLACDSRELEWEKLKFEKNKVEIESKRSFKDRVTSIGTTVFTTISSIFLAKKIMKFEEEGVLTSKSWNQCVPKIRWK